MSEAARLAQHLYASLLICTEAGTHAHPTVDNTPAENGLEVRSRLVQWFDLAPADANLNLAGKTSTPPKGKIEYIPFLIEQREAMVWRQDERIGRQARTDGTEQAIMMDMRSVELERRLVLNSDTNDTCPKVK